jgi:hypothetical protein
MRVSLQHHGMLEIHSNIGKHSPSKSNVIPTPLAINAGLPFDSLALKNYCGPEPNDFGLSFMSTKLPIFRYCTHGGKTLHSQGK